MRTIKPPNEHVACPRCNAVLEILPQDIIEDDVGQSPFSLYVVCPHCRSHVDCREAGRRLGVKL